MHIGKSVVIKGELNGSEDLTIEGHVEGKIELRDHVLTIGPNGKIRASVFAKAVIVVGEVVGNITSTEKVEIRDNGSVDGDIISPRVAIAEGAHFRGSVDMKRGGAAAGVKPRRAAESRSEASARDDRHRAGREPRPAKGGGLVGRRTRWASRPENPGGDYSAGLAARAGIRKGVGHRIDLSPPVLEPCTPPRRCGSSSRR